jgi:predicted O-linked N-acetylglucosamine transferase (SPINDLY family)
MTDNELGKYITRAMLKNRNVIARLSEITQKLGQVGLETTRTAVQTDEILKQLETKIDNPDDIRDLYRKVNELCDVEWKIHREVLNSMQYIEEVLSEFKKLEV